MASSERRLFWEKLLCSSRLGLSAHNSPIFPGRTEFDRDYDRIVFSEPFRNLQDKTQVFPLSPSDYTRTRLTHSLEVSCVGRSLGQLGGEYLVEKGLLPDDVSPFNIGMIVAAACLAHDLGNPPFGHSGEDAIQQWAARQLNNKSLLQDFTEEERRDFLRFEGNAQSFRILAKTQGREHRGGIRLTHATLGTLFKYPRPSCVADDVMQQFSSDVAFKKFNYFQAEAELAVEVCRVTGVPERAAGVYARHPLTFLMEAADDICYAIVDLEDAHRLKLISFETLRDLLHPLCYADYSFPDEKFEHDTAVVMLRSYAISSLVQACIEVWKEQLESIENGTFGDSLIKASGLFESYRALKQFAREKVYDDERVLLIEYAGYETLGGLLDFFYSAIVARGEALRDRKLRRIMPISNLRFGGQTQDSPEAYLESLSAYERLLCVTDYISGLTDSAAVDLYQKLSGIKLPR
ncbi:deoxyguanosinetriphosphate triphosphohydrolase [bacterium]|nr:MAG: deoxyguanosinetriphosphate triphosphohydrolase [bacterium]